MVIGVSGGADSMMLLDTLRRMAARRSWHIIVAHVHYGIRRRANRDRNCVQRYCERHALPFYVHDIHAENHPHDEAWMRTERYEFFARIANRCQATHLVVGHTRDDRVETLLLHLLRGTAHGGGLPYRRREGPYTVVRPLLDCTRVQTHRYCYERDVPYVTDKTNRDTRYRRNHIRHRLLPFLRTHYGSSVDQILSRAAMILQEDAQYLYDMARRAVPHHPTADGIEFSAAEFRIQHSTIQRAFIRYIAHRCGVFAPGASATELLCHAASGTRRAMVTIRTRSLLLVRKGDKVSVSRTKLSTR